MTALRNHKINARNTYNALTEDLQYMAGQLRSKVYNIDNMKDEVKQLEEMKAQLQKMIDLANNS